MISNVIHRAGGAALLALVGAAVVVSSGAAPAGHVSSIEAVPAPAPVDLRPGVSFAEDVLPIFKTKCAECHGAENESGIPWEEAGLNLLSYERVMQGSEFGTVVEPGSPDNSFLYTQVMTGDMPQEGDPLTEEEKNIIKAWIEAGAPNN